jgi:hypothetical protein
MPAAVPRCGSWKLAAHPRRHAIEMARGERGQSMIVFVNNL